MKIEPGLDHGVGTVRNDDGRRGSKRRQDREINLFPIIVGHIERILVHNFPNDHLSTRQPQLAQVAFDFCIDIDDRASLFRIDLLDGAAGGQ